MDEVLCTDQAGNHKLISNKHEWNNCFIKFQTLDKNILNDLSFQPFKGNFFGIKLSVSIFRQTTGYRIYTMHRKPKISDYWKFSIQCLVPVFNKIFYVWSCMYSPYM